MSHEVETMAYANKVPWHGLGRQVDQTISIEEMQKAAGLDWTLDPYPLIVGPRATTEAEDPVVGKVVNRIAHIRSSDGKIMAVSDPRWQAVQPAEVLGFMKEYVEAGAATLETAGSLRGGKVVWGLARINHSFEVHKGDRVNGYLLFQTPNEVGKATTIRTTTVRVVCANTMVLASRKGNGLTHHRQGHMGEFDFSGAKDAVGNAVEELRVAEASSKTLSKLKLGLEDALTKVIVPVFYPEIARKDKETIQGLLLPEAQPAKLQQIIDSINKAPGASPGDGWGILNGVTHWADHVSGRKAEARMFNSWAGENLLRKQEVEAKLLELAS